MTLTCLHPGRRFATRQASIATSPPPATTTVSGISGRSPAFTRRRKPVKATTRVLDCTASARFRPTNLIHFYLDCHPDGEEYIGYVAVMMLCETVHEQCLTGHLVMKSSRSARFSPENEHGSRATVPGFAICIGEQFKRATVRTPLKAKDRPG